MLDKNRDSLKWWESQVSNFPKLSNLGYLALKYLSFPPSSVEGELLFSIGGNVYTPHRNRLTAARGDMLVFIYNYNLRIFKFNY